MSASFEHQSFHPNLEHDPQSDADALLAKVRALRDEIITAWAERAVVLSKYEQERLHQEITKTCELLADLTRTR